MLGAAWQVLGTVFYAAIQLLIIAAISHMMGLEVLGEYAYATAILTPLVILLNFGLRLLIASDTRNRYQGANIIKLRLLGMFLFLLFCSLLYPFVDGVAMFLLVAAIKIAEAPAEVSYGVYIKNKESKKYLISVLLKLILMFVLALLFWALGFPEYYILYSIPVAFLIAYFAFDIKSIVSFRGGSELPVLEVFKAGILVSLSSLVIAAVSSLPKLIVGEQLGMAELAKFSVLIQIISLGMIPVLAANQYMMPHYSQNKRDGRMTKIMFTFGFGMSMVFGLAFYFTASMIEAVLLGETGVFTPEIIFSAWILYACQAIVVHTNIKAIAGSGRKSVLHVNLCSIAVFSILILLASRNGGLEYICYAMAVGYLGVLLLYILYPKIEHFYARHC